MTTNILSPKWRGLLADPIDPASVRFAIVRAPVYADCEGCMFSGQRSTVCDKVAEIARERGITNCESPLPDGSSGIYIVDESDPRQLQLEIAGQKSAGTDSAPNQK